METYFRLGQLFLGWFMVLCGIGLLLTIVANTVVHYYCYGKSKSINKITEEIDWSELSYFSNELLDFTYQDCLKNIDISEDSCKKIDKKTEFLLTYFLFCIAGLSTLLFKDSINMTQKYIIFTWITSNALLVLYTSYKLFAPKKEYFHHYPMPYFVLQKLHTQDDTPETDLRQSKQRNLKFLNDVAIHHNNINIKKGKYLFWIISIAITFNLIFAGAFILQL